MYNMQSGKLYCVSGNYNISQTQTDSGCKYLITLGYIMKLTIDHNQSCDRKAQAFLIILLLIPHP